MRNRFGWILVKDKFWGAYETNRLVEEFKKQDINIQRAQDSLERSTKRLAEKTIDIERARESINRAKNRISIANKKD